MEVLAQWGPWRSGEQGSKGLLMPQDGIAALNTIPRRDGALQARNPIVALTPTGVPNGVGSGFIPIGVDMVGCMIGGNFWQIPQSGAATNRGAFAVTITCWCIESPTSTLFASSAGNIYRVTQAAGPALVAGPIGTGLRFISTWNERLWVAGGSTGGTPVGVVNRVYYSDPNAFGTFAATSFIDVTGSTNTPICGFVRQRDSMLVLGNYGDRTRLFRISGTPGVSLRVDPINELPLTNYDWASGTNGFAYGAVRDPSLYTLTGGLVPAVISGESIQVFDQLGTVNDGLLAVGFAAPRVTPFGTPCVSPLMGRMAIWPAVDNSSNFCFILFHPDTGFSVHRFEGAIGLLSSAFTGAGMIAVSPNQFLAVKNGTAGTPVQLWRWTLNMDTAAPVDTTVFTENGAALSFFTDTAFAEVPPNQLWTPQQIVVDLRQWNTGSASSNNVDVELECIHPYTGEPVRSSLVSFSEALGGVALNAMERRRVRGAIAQSGGGPLLPTSAMRARIVSARGVAVERITVLGRVEALEAVL